MLHFFSSSIMRPEGAVVERLGDELAPRALPLLELHGDAPGLLEDGLERHLEVLPFRVGEALRAKAVSS